MKYMRLRTGLNTCLLGITKVERKELTRNHDFGGFLQERR